MKNELIKLEDNLSKIGASVLQNLAPGITGDELAKSVELIFGQGTSISNDLASLYQWHDGTSNSNFAEEQFKKCYLAYEIFFNNLAAIRKIVEEDSFYHFANGKMFPAFSSLHGEYLAVKLDEEGKVYYCSTSDSEIDFVTSMFDSISSLIETLNKLYSIGYYYLADENIIEPNFDKYDEYLKIGASLNPNCDYWKIKIEISNE